MASLAPSTPKKSETKAATETQATGKAPTEAQIRARAHEIYVQRGGQNGSELDDWLQAERELRGSAGTGA
jgi:Protein of unknown function (DUF2934)